MKRLIICLLAIVCIPIFADAATNTGSVSGRLYVPNSERGLRPQSGGDGHGFIGWDLSAAKNRQTSPSDIWLISQSIDMNKLTDEEISAWYREGKIPSGLPIYHVNTDGNGKYCFTDIPVDNYFLVVLDATGHANHTNLADREAFKKKMRDWDDFELFMVGMKGLSVDRITVEAGKETTVKANVFM